MNRIFVYHFEITSVLFLFRTREILQFYDNLWKLIYKFLEVSEQGLYPRYLSVYRAEGILYRECLCIYAMKNMVCSKRSKLEFRLVWCVEYEYSSTARACDSYYSHQTRHEKSNFSSLLHNMQFSCFTKKHFTGTKKKFFCVLVRNQISLGIKMFAFENSFLY